MSQGTRRIMRVGTGWLWAAVLCLVGVWLWGMQGRLAAKGPPVLPVTARGLAVWAIAYGQFLFMMRVADDLCSQAPRWLSGFLKTFTGVLAWGALAWTLVMLVHLLVF